MNSCHTPSHHHPAALYLAAAAATNVHPGAAMAAAMAAAAAATSGHPSFTPPIPSGFHHHDPSLTPIEGATPSPQTQLDVSPPVEMQN